jgi:MFS family permease
MAIGCSEVAEKRYFTAKPRFALKNIITRTVWVLSWVSLFTDMASEMLYPVMPIYLQSIGFSVFLIGVLEGVAEATAGLSKGYFGKLSDGLGRRLPFVQWGYGLSALSKPMMALFATPLWVFLARTTDRLGKGIRTGARDAMLSEEATPETKGRIFGLHRSMDTMGAVLGPGLALAFLYFYPARYEWLFFLAFIPGVLSIALTWFLKETAHQPKANATPINFFSFLRYWRESPQAYRRIVMGLLVFTAFNSSDIFLLLRLRESGMSDTAVLATYIFYNLIFALSAYPMGILADRLGLKRTFLFGLLLFAVVYVGMSLNTDPWGYYGLFFLYGIYAASTEGISKAWISNITEKKDLATAIGTYAGFNSLCTMAASALAGWIWFMLGPEASFLLTGLVTLGVMVYFILLKIGEGKEENSN